MVFDMVFNWIKTNIFNTREKPYITDPLELKSKERENRHHVSIDTTIIIFIIIIILIAKLTKVFLRNYIKKEKKKEEKLEEGRNKSIVELRQLNYDGCCE